MAVGAALALLAPSAAAALQGETTSEAGAVVGPARSVEIRVAGDAAALARVRMTARELLRRLDVEAIVKGVDEPDASRSGPPPLVVAHVDLRSLASPSIEIADGSTRQELTRRSINDATSLETGVEALLHVLYLTVESSLQVASERPAVPVKPAPPARPAKSAPQRTRFGFDLGPLFRLSSLGSGRIVPGGGLAFEPRADFGRSQLGLLLSGVAHGTSELAFEGGVADIRPMQARVVPTFDWLFSSDVSGCFGLGGGLDSFVTDAVAAPESGRTIDGQSAVDPVLTGLVGARVPLSKRVFLSALVSLDVDLAPTSFVAHEGEQGETLLELPRLRGGFTLALSFTAAGEGRFVPRGREP